MTEATGPDTMLVDATDDLLEQIVTPAVLHDAERDGWAASTWTAIAEMGLPWISVPESAGGQGGTLGDALGVLRVAGYHGLPLPLAETGVLGGWLLASAGLSVPELPLSAVAPAAEDALSWDGSRLSGTLERVPWARGAGQIVTLVTTPDGPLVVAVTPDSVRIEDRRNLAGEPRETVTLEAVTPVAVAPAGDGVDLEALRLRGALSRVCLMSGALDRVQETTIRYTGERQQFGRALTRFQHVQTHIVHIAQQTAILAMAADLASREAERGAATMEIWSAKTLAGEATRIATRAAHQAHGAMGMTQEYSLHHATRRLWSWAHEYGENEWADQIGAAVVAAGADGMYPLITGGSAALAG